LLRIYGHHHPHCPLQLPRGSSRQSSWRWSFSTASESKSTSCARKQLGCARATVWCQRQLSFHRSSTGEGDRSAAHLATRVLAPTMSFQPATPARPVPGSYVNTPGPAPRFAPDPVRRQLFPSADPTQSGPSTSLQNPAPVAQPAPVAAVPGGAVLPTRPIEDVPPVVKAAKAINAFLQLDENFAGVDNYSGRKLASP
jgi:hypothetical protein